MLYPAYSDRNGHWGERGAHAFNTALFALLLLFAVDARVDAQPAPSAVIEPLAQPKTDPFKSSAIPQDMFREGEVARFERSYGDWRLVCDEIVRTKQRFCSAYSKLKTNGAFSSLTTIVSTSDSGSLAAILYFPLGSYISHGVEIAVKGGKEKIKTNFVQCDAKSCSTIFPLKGKILQSLLAGQSVSVVFSLIVGDSVVGDSLRLTTNLANKATKVSLEWSGAGLVDALQNSVK